MPLHHVLSRSALLILGIWAGGGCFLLSCIGLRWGRHGETRATQIATPITAMFAAIPRNMQNATPAAGSDLLFRAAQYASSETRGTQASTGWHRIRSASPIGLDYPPEARLVSVVIPTHNRAHIVGRAIESALAQTYSDVQVIVADDGSSDNTRAVAEAYGSRVTYVRQANVGVSAARNFGMRHARGEFIAFLDSDDGWLPWKIEAQLAALARHPEAGLVWTDMAAVDDADRLIESRHIRVMYSAYENVNIENTLAEVDTLGTLTASAPPELRSALVREGDLFSAIMLGNLIHTSTVLFRRSWCERTGGFDESYARAGEDYEFYIRLCSAGPSIFIDAPSTLYRIGAADQLTAPAMMLEIACNNLRAIQEWVPQSVSQLELSRATIRRRFAESFAWVGEAELNAGHPWRAARRLSKSIATLPAFDRRTVLLASCALPHKVREGLRSARRAILARDVAHAGSRSSA